MAAEPAFLARVELADRLGIPPSQLDGREPATVTEHEYDELGRPIRSIATSEPRFTEQDLAELLALGEYRAGLCPLCGRPLDVCTSEEADPKSPKFDVAWRVCRAQRRLSEFKRATYTDTNHPHREAHLLGTTIRKR